MPVWVRGEERAEIVSPFPQPLVVTALGNSGATPAARASRPKWSASTASPRSRRRPTRRCAAGSSSSTMRWRRPRTDRATASSARRAGRARPIASRKGAAAIVVRSIGTDYHRNPHTGVQTFGEGVAADPGRRAVHPRRRAAPAHPEPRARPVRMRLTLTPRNIGRRQSGQRRRRGAGQRSGGRHDPDRRPSRQLGSRHRRDRQCRRASRSPPRRRTGSCRRAGRGGRSASSCSAPRRSAASAATPISRRHRETGNIVLVGESDFGADRVWRVEFKLRPGQRGARRPGRRLARAARHRARARAAPAPAPISATGSRPGVAAIDLSQDGTRYFDYHHTPDDTLDKIDPAQLRQNVAAWTAMLAAVADAPGSDRRNGPHPTGALTGPNRLTFIAAQSKGPSRRGARRRPRVVNRRRFTPFLLGPAWLAAHAAARAAQSAPAPTAQPAGQDLSILSIEELAQIAGPLGLQARGAAERARRPLSS